MPSSMRGMDVGVGKDGWLVTRLEVDGALPGQEDEVAWHGRSPSFDILFMLFQVLFYGWRYRIFIDRLGLKIGTGKI